MRLTRGRADRSRICRDVIRVRKEPHGWQFLIITNSPKQYADQTSDRLRGDPPEVTPKPKYFVTYLQISSGGVDSIYSAYAKTSLGVLPETDMLSICEIPTPAELYPGVGRPRVALDAP